MPRLFVVDDEPQMCEALRVALSHEGCTVRTFVSGTRAVEVFRRERADVVFCDVRLPGLDGLAVLKAMKGIDPWATVVMVTAYGAVETARQALRLGAYDFLEKPVSVAQIQQVAQRALAHHRQLRQLALLQGKPGTAVDLPARLAELEQVRADFLTLVIQDLRRPFRLLGEELSLIHSGFYGAWVDPLRQQLVHQLTRIQGLLSRVIMAGLAFFVSHEQQVADGPCDVGAVLEEAIVHEVQPRCHAHGLTLLFSRPPTPVAGRTDAGKVVAVARELFDNAIAATPPGGRIGVEVTSSPHGFQLRILDTGCGISAEAQASLFTAWYRPRVGGLERQRPVGLGLALVRHYVDLLNGDVTVTSEPGHGSQFTVTLPWLDQHEPRRP